jgi:hypothetical protein
MASMATMINVRLATVRSAFFIWIGLPLFTQRQRGWFRHGPSSSGIRPM